MNEKRAQLAAELETNLPHFTGTEEYHRLRYPWLRRQFLITDGLKFVADKASAYWLLDIIASHFSNQRVASEPFQVWRLIVNLDGQGDLGRFEEVQDDNQAQQAIRSWLPTSKSGQALIVADDGNGKLLVQQAIPYTSFPLPEFTFYVTNDEFNGIVVMLTSEY
jgi:hypothetical protein